MAEGLPRKHRVLVAAEAPQDVQTLDRALEDFCSLTIVSNQAAVVEAIEHGPFPDLIILAIEMSEMDGYEACRQITGDDRWASIPLVLLATHSETIDRTKAYEAGAADYLTRPLSVEEIRARVGTHLELSSRCAGAERKKRDNQELLRILSHDLSNALTVVVWALDLLNDDLDRFEKLEKSMRSAASKGFALIEIIQQLRFAEEKPAVLGSVNLDLAVRSSLSLLEEQIREKNISLQVEIDDSTLVLAESTSLVDSVLKNVISNAVRFSETGAAVRISARRERGMIALSVSDVGDGIPSEHLDQIFDVTRLTNRAGTRGEKGAGFGMVLARRFVDAYGGEIEVVSLSVDDSPEEHGTTFTIRLLPASAVER